MCLCNMQCQMNFMQIFTDQKKIYSDLLQEGNNIYITINELM